MFGNSITIFKLLGFEVKVDASWLILALLIVWTLSVGFFPYAYRGFSKGTYWWMGVAGALGLFVSIVFHEFFHSIVARKYGLPMKGITLFLFGGVSEMEDQPQSAKVEFLMAVVGPLSSVFLGAVFYGISFLIKAGGVALPVGGVTGYLAYINFLLAAFNLLPAFPLDGGRVLRSALWKYKGNIRWATRIASQVGATFGLLLIFLGVLGIFQGNLVGGIWMSLIGLFLRSTARASYQQVMLRKVLEGQSVQRFMKENPVSVPPSISVGQLVEDYFYKFHYKMFPVAGNGTLEGCITMGELKDIPREEWDRHAVREYVRQCSPDNTVTPSMEAVKALTQMSRTGNDKLMVVEGSRLVGIVTLKDILQFFSTKMELEEAGKK
ncbi:MAG TPA: site-2 protease family protein [Dissulfurispiraceae bacterium]